MENINKMEFLFAVIKAKPLKLLYIPFIIHCHILLPCEAWKQTDQ